MNVCVKRIRSLIAKLRKYMLDIFRISLSLVIIMKRMTQPVIPNIERTISTGNRTCRMKYLYSSQCIDFCFSFSYLSQSKSHIYHVLSSKD